MAIARGGGALPARQEDLRINGHAFEARLYAEDVPAGFLPATGYINPWSFPMLQGMTRAYVRWTISRSMIR